MVKFLKKITSAIEVMCPKNNKGKSWLKTF